MSTCIANSNSLQGILKTLHLIHLVGVIRQHNRKLFVLFWLTFTPDIFQVRCGNLFRDMEVITLCIAVFLPSDGNAALQEFLRSCNPRQQHSVTLESYLIKPIQRILKYPLLLGQLVDLTEPRTEEHQYLTGAWTYITSIAWTFFVGLWHDTTILLETDSRPSISLFLTCVSG